MKSLKKICGLGLIIAGCVLTIVMFKGKSKPNAHSYVDIPQVLFINGQAVTTTQQLSPCNAANCFTISDNGYSCHCDSIIGPAPKDKICKIGN